MYASFNTLRLSKLDSRLPIVGGCAPSRLDLSLKQPVLVCLREHYKNSCEFLFCLSVPDGAANGRFYVLKLVKKKTQGFICAHQFVLPV